MLYNAIFTSWPCIFTFVLERDVGYEESMNNPILYQAGHKRYYFNYAEFWKWILLALWHGAVSYFIPMYGMVGPYDTTGKTTEHWVNTTVSFSIILHVVTYKLFVDTYFWSKINLIMAGVSILIYYFVVVMGSVQFIANMLQAEATGVFFIMAANPRFWFMIIIVPFMCLIPDVTIVSIRRMFFQKPCDAAVRAAKGIVSKSGSTRRAPANPKHQVIEISEWLKPEPDSKAKINESEFFDIHNAPDGNYFDDTEDLGYLKKSTGKNLNIKGFKSSIKDDSTYGKEEDINILKHVNKRSKQPSVTIIEPGICFPIFSF